MATAKKKTHPKSGTKPAKKRVSNERRFIKSNKTKKASKKSGKRHSISRGKTKQSKRIRARPKKDGRRSSKSKRTEKEISKRARGNEIEKRVDLLSKNKIDLFTISGLAVADRKDLIQRAINYDKLKKQEKEKVLDLGEKVNYKVDNDINKRIKINRKARDNKGEKILTKKGERKPLSKKSTDKFDKSLKEVSNIAETTFLVGDKNLGLQAVATNYDDAITIIEKLKVMPGAFMQIQVIPKDEILEKYFSDRPFSSTMFREIHTTQKRDVVEISLENIITSYMQNRWGVKEIRINYHVT